MDSWFQVDRAGLAKLLERKGKAFAVLELIQNAWDEDVTTVDIQLDSVAGGKRATLQVSDNSPEGFKDLTHAYTLFAESSKKGDPEKRGRFNLGEKLVLALCVEARVKSTKGTIVFDRDGKRRQLREKSSVGTQFTATLNLTKAEVAEAISVVESVLPPLGIETRLNGKLLEPRVAVKTWVEALETEIADAEGYLRRTRRRAPVSIYEVGPDETAHIYEMGIPVVEHDGQWHINVEQKIPLNVDRDNVTPAYLRALRTTVLDHTLDLIDNTSANSVWVKDALPHATEEAVVEVVRQRFGDKVVIFDPSDHEANKRALDQGYNVVHGRSLSKPEWEAIRRADAIQPAGKVLPSGIQPTGDVAPLTENDWSPGQRIVAWYAKALSKELLGVECSVSYYPFERKSAPSWQAAWGTVNGIIRLIPNLSVNLAKTDKDWFDHPRSHQREWDALLIHEFGHNIANDHFSDLYLETLCNLGAALRDSKERL